MFQPIMLLAGFAGALLFAGGAGILARLAGATLGWGEVGQLMMTGSGIGLALAIAHDLVDRRLERRATVREKEAGAWLKEVQAERLAAELDAAKAPPQPEPGEAERKAAAWASALETFFLAGNKAEGFSIDKLAGCIGSDAWARVTGFYASPAGRNVLRVAPGNVGTVWGHGWGLDAAIRALRAGSLPYPDGDVPAVTPFIADTTRRNAPRKSKTQTPEVIEGSATTLS
jgi:hypothetical protein